MYKTVAQVGEHDELRTTDNVLVLRRFYLLAKKTWKL